MIRLHALRIAYDTSLYCWILSIIVVYGFFGLGWSALIGAVACVALISRLAWDSEFRTQVVPMPIDYLILAIWLVEGFGLTRSIYYRNTLQSFISLSTLISVYYVLRFSIINRLHRVGIWLVGAATALVVAFATIGETVYFQIIMASYNLGNASNIRTVFSVPVSGGSGTERLSVLLVLLPFPVLVAVEFWQKNRGVSIIGSAATLMLLVSVALTLSRGMYLATTIFILLFLVLLLRYSTIRRRIVLGGAVIAASVYFAIIPWQRSVITTVLMNHTSMQVRSTQGRIDLWKMYLAAAKDHPALGIGRGNLALIPVHLDNRDPAEGYVYASAFNTGIMLFIEDGGIGLCCYLMLLAWFVFGAMQYLRKGLEQSDLLEMCLCLSAVVSVCVRDCTTSTLLTQPMTGLLVCVLAALVGRPLQSSTWHSHWSNDLVGARAPRIALSSVAVFFVATLSVLSWNALRIEHADNCYEDCAVALMEGNYSAAKEAIESAVKLDSGNALYIAAQGLVNAQTLDTRSFRWPVENIVKGLSADQLESLRSAAADYRLVVRLNPSDALAWHNLGWLNFFLGNYEQALSIMQRSAALDETDWTTRVSLGLQLESADRVAEALAAYQEALMLNPQLVETQFFADLEQRHPDSAKAIVSQALTRLERDYYTTHSPILAAKAGKLALFQGDLGLAATNLEFATRQMPLLYRAWMNLAALHNLRGEHAEAKRCLDIAQMINPSDAGSREQRGEHSSSSETSNDVDPGSSEISPQELEEFGHLSDRNMTLSREYLRDPEIINNVVPRNLLVYCSVIHGHKLIQSYLNGQE